MDGFNGTLVAARTCILHTCCFNLLILSDAKLFQKTWLPRYQPPSRPSNVAYTNWYYGESRYRPSHRLVCTLVGQDTIRERTELAESIHRKFVLVLHYVMSDHIVWLFTMVFQDHHGRPDQHAPLPRL